MTKINDWKNYFYAYTKVWPSLITIVTFLFASILVVNPVHSIFSSFLFEIILLVGLCAFYYSYKLVSNNKKNEIICFATALVCFSVQGVHSLIAISLTIMYFKLSQKNFFLSEKLRSNLLLKTLLQNTIILLLSFAVFSFLTQTSLWKLLQIPTLIYFSLINWFMFNIFEISKKTNATIEELTNVKTFSNTYGRVGAVTLLAIPAIMAHFLSLQLKGIDQSFFLWSSGALLLTLFIVSFNYILTNKTSASRTYRSFIFFYIITFYLVIIISSIVP